MLYWWSLYHQSLSSACSLSLSLYWLGCFHLQVTESPGPDWQDYQDVYLASKEVQRWRRIQQLSHCSLALLYSTMPSALAQKQGGPSSSRCYTQQWPVLGRDEELSHLCLLGVKKRTQQPLHPSILLHTTHWPKIIIRPFQTSYLEEEWDYHDG